MLDHILYQLSICQIYLSDMFVTNMRNRKKIIRFAEIAWIIRKILKIDIRICNNIENNHYIETIEFSIFCIRNYIKIDEKIINVSTLQTDIQFQKNVSSTQTRTTCEKICRQFIFLIDAIESTCKSMKISTISLSFFVSFAIHSKTNVWIFYIFRIDRFNRKFIFHEFYIRNNMSIRRKINNHIIREFWYF